jgi:IS30 family transposase
MPYTHLSREQRYQIHALRRQSLSYERIAALVGCHASTVSREFKRNSGPRGYRPGAAHDKARSRQTQRRNARAFTPQQWAHVTHYLRAKLSPQQVAGRLKAESAFDISHETIYRFVYRDQRQGGELIGHLRCQKTRRKRYGSGQQRRGKLNDRVCIEQRDPIVDQRSRMGDWEGDTVIGKGHQGALVTLVERQSRYTLAMRVNSRHSEGVTQAIVQMLRPHKEQCLTLTFDNGKEFAEHAFIGKALQAQVYFAHPYRSWERGLNENTNGLLRQYFPKSTNLLKVTDEEVDDAVYALNHRPRKCLGYRTPHEVFYGLEITPIKLPSDALCL